MTLLGVSAGGQTQDGSDRSGPATVVSPESQSRNLASGGEHAATEHPRATTGSSARKLDPRTLRMLHGKSAPTLRRMAVPTAAMVVAQSSVALIQIWYVSRLGIDSLAGISLVFPGWMMMQVLCAGSLGGGFLVVYQGGMRREGDLERGRPLAI
jgi:hypothetical protein